METVKLSNLDRLINLHQSFELHDVKKINQKILREQILQNEELQRLNSQLLVANQLNRQILSNQISQIKLKETQRFYKALSFKMHEFITPIENIIDPLVKKYFIDKYYDKIKTIALTANNELDEISDKVFTREIIIKAEKIKAICTIYKKQFETSPLNEIDVLLQQLELKKQEISKLQYPSFPKTEIKIKRKTNIFRLIGLIVFGFITFFILLATLLAATTKDNPGAVSFIFLYMIFVLPFSIILFRDIKWRKSYTKYLLFQDEKKQLEKLKKNEAYNSYLLNKETLNKELLEHPALVIYENIIQTYPEFEQIVGELNNLEMGVR